MPDNFYLEKIFPESTAVFSLQNKTTQETKDNCIYVLDTNILLVPYLTGKESAKDFERIFNKLKTANRLFIPERVAREFAKNRGQRIADTYSRIFQSREKLNNSQIMLEPFPILEGNTDYARLKEIESQINKLKEEFRSKLDALSDELMNWSWNDPVSKMYRDIFTSEMIVPIQRSEAEIIKELQFRNEHQVPPGFKKSDQNKPDNGIGDIINWLTTLEIGKDKNTDVIFVTNEEHNDWFYRHQNTAILPRYELIDEFRRFTNGKSINIINFSNFLKIQNANDNTVSEVEKVSDSDLIIISATYFTNQFSLNATEALQALVSNNKLNVLANNEIVGDPHVGVAKKLEVFYVMNNKKGTPGKPVRRIYNEHEFIELP